jgi:uncharacterized membrane protein (DUF4010 family)
VLHECRGDAAPPTGGTAAAFEELLIEKSRLHALVKRIDDVGLRSAVRFAAMALVILLAFGAVAANAVLYPRVLLATAIFKSC